VKTEEEVLEEEIPASLDKSDLMELISNDLSPVYLDETEDVPERTLFVPELAHITNFDDLTKRIAVYNKYIETVTEGLSREVSLHYDTLVDGMNNI
jgi:hypothetical protein